MSDREPPRLGEDGSEASEALRSLLRSAREVSPSREQVERLEARLAPVLGGAAAAAGLGQAAGASSAVSSSSAPAAASVLPGLVKISAALLVAGGLVGAGLWAFGGGDDVQQAKPQRSAPVSAERAERAEPLASPPVGSAAAPASEPKASAELDSRPRAGATSESVVGGGRSEAGLLQQAQAALKSNPQGALGLCRTHAKEFPNGPLSQEREVIAIEALVRLGRRSEAERRAQSFQRQFPGSAHQRKIEALLHQ
jgi:hypothetical protein